jgi:hypothetical protein
MRRTLIAVTIGLLAGACQLPPPAIADISQDKVIIQSMATPESPAIAQVNAEAAAACAMYSRKPVRLSFRQVGGDRFVPVFAYLYACRPENEADRMPALTVTNGWRK